MRFRLAAVIAFAMLVLFPSPWERSGLDRARRFGSHGLDDRRNGSNRMRCQNVGRCR